MQKILLLLALVLLGCQQGTNTPPKVIGSGGTLSGVAAVGTPIVGGNITAVCAAGSQLTTTSDSNGSWTVTLTGQTLPCALEVTGGTVNGVSNTTAYHSIAVSAGTVNITPLTDLLVANMAGQNPNAWFAGLSSTSSTFTAYNQAAVSTALSALSSSFTGLKPLNSTNPITTSFTPTSGNVSDDMLSALSTAVTNAGVTYATLINNMSSGTMPATAVNTSLTTAYAATVSGSATYSIGVVVSGLTGTGLVLQNNLGDSLSVSGSGSSTFATRIVTGSTYSITVSTQPSGQICYVVGGSGVVSNTNVSGTKVVCVATSGTVSNYSIGVSVSGLTGTGLVLQNNYGDSLTVSANGSTNFAKQLPTGSTYSISVLTQPITLTCVVGNGGGTVATANVSSPSVTCSSTTTKSYSVGVTASGLTGTGLVLQNNFGDNLAISANGSINFVTQLYSGSAYSVSVLNQPTNQICVVANGSGTVSGAVSNISLSCASGAVAYYCFDDSSNIGKDCSASGNNGTVSGGVSGVAGVVGGGALFGGYNNPGSIHVPNSASLQFGTANSVSYFIKIDNPAGMSIYGSFATYGLFAVVAKSHDVSSLTWMASINTSNQLSAGYGQYPGLILTSGTQVMNNGTNILNGLATGATGRWVHVVQVFDSVGAKTYYDGQLADSWSGSVDFTSTNTQDMYIGKFSDTWYPLNGTLDELKIFNRALSAAEVQVLYAH